MTQKRDRLSMLEAMIDGGNRDPFVRYARAMELRSQKRLDDALAAFREVISSDPGYVPTYLMSAQVAIELGERAEARALIEAGLPLARAAGDSRAVSELSDALEDLLD
jgi:tetratricopeptide (TPR) repeat protein